ncbi:MAG TPA: response regulator [Planctomycetota bacterium]|nr:response regulator [Planctomycetota bacterium]
MPDAPPPPYKEYATVVLLIDDQAIIAEAVRRALADDATIQFHAVHEPSRAVSKAVEVSPTVILLDLVMPDIDGMTVLKFLKANSKLRDIPVIVMSSKEDKETKIAAFSGGASDYVVKIPEKTELRARVLAHSKGYIHLLQRNELAKALSASKG